MAEDINQEISDALHKSLAAGLSEEAVKALTKKVDDITCFIEDDIMYRLKDKMAPNLVSFVEDMARKTVECLLQGNADQMRRYLSCEKRDSSGEYTGWTGRFNPGAWGARRHIVDQHPVIHGKLFEQGCVQLRRDIVNAHADLLKDERILDLEDQVRSLVEQVNKANAEKEKVLDRLRGVQLSV
jgi:hypothetical protein